MGYKVLLSTRNLKLKLLRKIQDHYMGLFEELKRVGPIACKLDLSHSFVLKIIHLVFFIIILRDFVDIGLKYQLPPIKVDGEWEYEIEATMGHWTYR